MLKQEARLKSGIWLFLSLFVTLMLVVVVYADISGQLYPKRILSNHQKLVTSVSFSPTSKLLASSSLDSTINLWDVEKGRLESVLTAHRGSVHVVTFSPDGTLLASGGSDKLVRLWDVSTRKLRSSIVVPYSIDSLIFSPDSKKIACGGRSRTGQVEGQINIFQVESRDIVSSMSYKIGDETGLVTSMDFTPDGSILATGGQESIVRLWDIPTGTLKDLTKCTSAAEIKFSADGNALFIVDYDLRSKGLLIYNLKNRQVEVAIPKTKGLIQAIALSPSNDIIAIATNHHKVTIWNLKNKKPLYTLPDEYFSPQDMNFSNDGKLLAITNEEKIEIWDTSDFR